MYKTDFCVISILLQVVAEIWSSIVWCTSNSKRTENKNKQRLSFISLCIIVSKYYCLFFPARQELSFTG